MSRDNQDIIKRVMDAEVGSNLVPSSLDAEQAVLCSILLLPDVLDEASLILRKDDFFHDANQRLYGCLLDLRNNNKPLDIRLIVESLKKSGDFDAIGGAAYLHEVTGVAPNAAHCAYYAKVIREKAAFRRIIALGTSMCEMSYEGRESAQEILGRIEQQLFAISERNVEVKTCAIRDVITEAMKTVDSKLRGEVPSGTIKTGFDQLDALTSGFHPAQLIVLAGRPSMGKTALAMNIVTYAGVTQGAMVLLVSLESSIAEVADRFLCATASVDSHRLRNGTLSGSERKSLVEAAGWLSQGKVVIEDGPHHSVMEIATIARRVSRKAGQPLGMIVVDYLQLIRPENVKDSRQEQVAGISRRLKGLAREMQCPVLCLAQLNRGVEETSDHRPRLSHLRESGAIEQDADLVMFIHRPSYYMRGEEAKERAHEALLIIAKHRNGPTGEVDLHWDSKCMRFHSRSTREPDAVDF